MFSRHSNVFPITFIAHSPERGQSRSGVPVQAGACCTCCCTCCLHTLGGIIGASVAPHWDASRPGLLSQEQTDYDDARFTPEGQIASASDKQAGGQSAVRIFWLTLLVLVGVVMLAGPLVVNGNAGVGLLGAAAVILLGLPALQLVAVVVTLIILATSGREKVGLEYRQVGRIAVGTFVGSLIGILIMGGLGLLIQR